MTRIEQLKQFILDDPADPFPRYALALEYLNSDVLLAKSEFDELLRQFVDYLPTYYPAAHLAIDMSEASRAEKLFVAGMEIAKRQGNTKTEMELKTAYNQWLAERG